MFVPHPLQAKHTEADVVSSDQDTTWEELR